MTGASASFLLFATAVVILFNLSGKPAWKSSVYLAGNLTFLVLLVSNPAQLAPIVAFTLAGYAGINWIKGGSQKVFTVSTILFVAIFVVLKKYTFLPERAFLPFPYLTIGLSYILFRVLHLFIEERNGALGPVGMVSYLNYTLGFTTLVSGPIQRFPEFDAMLSTPGRLAGASVVGSSIERIVRGLFKVHLLALAFSELHKTSIGHLYYPTYGVAGRALWGALAFSSYTFFLYCNFSGYIDVVIAIARTMGITLPENFDRPFSSESFIEFWARWHITLSGWLKDYVYVPVLTSLMRRFPERSIEPFLGAAAYFFTFFLVGVWHGQTSVFLFFGFLQGLGVAVNKLFQVFAMRFLGRKKYRELAARPLWISLSRGLTFTWFTFTLIWFWSDWKQIASIFSQIGPIGAAIVWGGTLVAASVVLTLWEAIRSVLVREPSPWGQFLSSRYTRTAWTTAQAVIVLVLSFLLDQPAPEIVYGKF
jgi:alginate O-acetyltransferase complex protein AlgI